MLRHAGREVRHRQIRRFQGPVVAAGVVFLVASCSMFAPADWSIRAENDAFDLVLRYVEDGAPSYFEFSNADGVVASGKGAPPATVSIATLDPVSCRPIGEVYGLSTSHTAVGVSFGGTITAGGYDPADFGEDWGLSDRLTPTDRCSDSDPSTTPAPAPAPMSVGDWLNGSEMACKTVGDSDAFVVRGEFLDGAVDGCEAWAGAAGQPIPSVGVVAWNPDGDGSRLAVAWRDARCASGATVSLYPDGDHYSLAVISIGTACHPPREVYQAVFHLTDPVDATDVVATLDIVFDP